MNAFDQFVHRAPRDEAESAERPVEGNIGIGLGAGATTPRRQTDRSQEISDAIKLAAGRLRGRVGVDDVFGNS